MSSGLTLSNCNFDDLFLFLTLFDIFAMALVNWTEQLNWPRLAGPVESKLRNCFVRKSKVRKTKTKKMKLRLWEKQKWERQKWKRRKWAKQKWEKLKGEKEWWGGDLGRLWSKTTLDKYSSQVKDFLGWTHLNLSLKFKSFLS